MGGATNKLTDLALRNSKPGTKTRKLSDGGGLFLEIRPNGSKYWRMAYRFAGKKNCWPLASILRSRRQGQGKKPRRLGNISWKEETPA